MLELVGATTVAVVIVLLIMFVAELLADLFTCLRMGWRVYWLLKPGSKPNLPKVILKQVLRWWWGIPWSRPDSVSRKDDGRTVYWPGRGPNGEDMV